MPKPANIKAKTINEIDNLIGAPPGSIGLVGYFVPELPPRPTNMGDADWQLVVDRKAERAKEYEDLSGDMKKLADEGTIHVMSGVVHALDPNGPKEGPARFRAVAGDVDIYQIRWADPNRDMSKADADFFAEQLRGMNIGVQHPAHLRWDPQTQKDIDIFENIVASHGPGGKPLLRFEPDANPGRVDNTTPITRRAPNQATITDVPPGPGTAGHGEGPAPDIGSDITPGSDWRPGKGEGPRVTANEPAAGGVKPAAGSATGTGGSRYQRQARPPPRRARSPAAHPMPTPPPANRGQPSSPRRRLAPRRRKPRRLPRCEKRSSSTRRQSSGCARSRRWGCRITPRCSSTPGSGMSSRARSSTKPTTAIPRTHPRRRIRRTRDRHPARRSTQPR